MTLYLFERQPDAKYPKEEFRKVGRLDILDSAIDQMKERGFVRVMPQRSFLAVRTPRPESLATTMPALESIEYRPVYASKELVGAYVFKGNE